MTISALVNKIISAIGSTLGTVLANMFSAIAGFF